MRPLDVRIEAALATRDEERRWALIASTVADGTAAAFETSIPLLASRQSRRRRLGADILGQIAETSPEITSRALPALLVALGRETDPDALASIVAALGHVGDPAAIGPIVLLAGHAYPEVRLAVAFALASIGPHPTTRAVVDALIRLSRDPDGEVRDWATFGLGTLSGADGADVRDALLARAEDAYPEARAEALFGLVVRNDPRAVPPLIRALESPVVGHLEVDTAAAAGDRRLLPALRELARTGRGDARRVAEAIERCEEGPAQKNGA